ncbi:MAG: NADH-quinone oxidoreductase subunit M [Bacteroidetes bacterium]|nr:MAG: NADH-quinone oxidoreductase subunit M [Bacteroidota bacterium]
MDPRNVIVTFPELLLWFPLLSGLIVLLLNKGDKAKNWSLVFSVITLTISVVSFMFTDAKWRPLNQVSYFWLPQIGSSFALMLDGAGRILCFLTAFAYPVIFLTTYKTKYKNPNIFYGLMLLTQSGLIGVFCAMDALVFYFFWELALVPVYFLASIWGGEKRIQATWKFFIYTFTGSLLLLVGIIYVYLHTTNSTFSLFSFYNAHLTAAEQNGIFWLFFVAFAIKMPIFPFHTWQPDTYEQSPSAVTMVLSGIMVKMGVFGLIRWLVPVLPLAVKHFDHVVIGLSVVGMIYASCIAIVQDDLKRLVAYSSIAHIGLMCAAVFSNSESGIQGVLIQMFNHGINIIGIWVVVEMIERQLGTRKISMLGGLAQKSPVLATLLVIVALANIALPLTNAFVGEFLIFNGLFKFSGWYTALAAISIILAAVYTLNMIQKVFYGETNSITVSAKDIGANEAIMLSVIVVAIFVVGVFPKPFFELSNDTVINFLSKLSGGK